MICSPKLASTFTGNILHLVNKLTSAVIALAGITLCIFVGKHTACGEKNCLRNDVLGCDKLDVAALTCKFSATRRADFRVEILYSFKKHIYILRN
jgi:hypothetical protein